MTLLCGLNPPIQIENIMSKLDITMSICNQSCNANLEDYYSSINNSFCVHLCSQVQNGKKTKPCLGNAMKLLPNSPIIDTNTMTLWYER